MVSGRIFTKGAKGGAVVITLVMAAVACGCTSASRPVDVRSAPSAPITVVSAETTATRDANIIGATLQLSMLVPTSFSAEPKGRLVADSPTRLYAHISAVSTASPSITFDVAQLYMGNSAVAEAKRDHKQVADSQVYERNAFKFAQTVSVVASTGVVLQFPREDIDPAYGPDDFAQLTATTFDDFARRFSAGEESGRLRRAGYWIVVDGEGVRSIAEQYQP